MGAEEVIPKGEGRGSVRDKGWSVSDKGWSVRDKGWSVRDEGWRVRDNGWVRDQGCGGWESKGQRQRARDKKRETAGGRQRVGDNG